MRQGTYLAHVRVDDITGRIMGYVVASYLFEQADVQNIIVSQADRGQGVGRALLQVLTKDLACHGVENIFLEVRPSNQAAVSLYQSAGFVLMQKRRGYYPLVSGLREDAWVFSLKCL
jgi:ribosomal-protein-alanine N-acetyltransferase